MSFWPISTDSWAPLCMLETLVNIHFHSNCRFSRPFYTEAERTTACSQHTMLSARVPSSSLTNPKHEQWRGLCHLLFLSLSHNLSEHQKTQWSTRTRALPWLEVLEKALWKTVLLFQIFPVPPWRRTVFFHPIDSTNHGTCFSSSRC